ncbi:hypothetical protein NQ314_014616 [Rhamnusium bicolor]|uniref:PiggyBac transposable element-derived protein domain-containing protein n=1 Tax=Rhamnusium bicolor TaxID=1586634 RepID=A0AAV8X162_9CUCU|nr:hypothetical protein NQ314_014616 [Rhamnusium bicolor]
MLNLLKHIWLSKEQDHSILHSKKRKNVVLLCSMHFDDAIDKNTHQQNKPEIITFYNSTKSGVDVVDKLGATYNCTRNTRRRTMVILYALMNVAGINS